MHDTTVVRRDLTVLTGPWPHRSAKTEFVVTVRVIADAEQSPAVAARIAETLRAILAPEQDTPLQPVPMPRGDDVTTHAPVLQIDVLYRTVRLRGVDLELARREFDLLLHLARHPAGSSAATRFSPRSGAPRNRQPHARWTSTSGDCGANSARTTA